MPAGEILYLSYQDVVDLKITMGQVVQWVDDVFRFKGLGKFEMPPKPGIHTMPDAFIHAMPAYIPDLKSAGIKWVSGYPDNYKRGLPYISGLLVLNDVETGIPTAVMDCTWITAMRTGAATAVAAKYLARKDSKTVGILACGVQGRANLDALAAVMKGIKTVKAYDILPEAQERYVKEMKAKFGFDVKGVASPKEAVVGSDIVVSTGPILKHPRPVIEAAWFKEGAFGCPVDFDSYWKDEALKAADKMFVDDIPQMVSFKDEGYFGGMPEKCYDLGDLVSGKVPGRTNDRERIISMNLGLGLEDMGVAPHVYRIALEKGIGRKLPL